MVCNIRSTYYTSHGKCCRNKKLTCTSPCSFLPTVCLCVECSLSLSFFRCSPRLQPTTARNRQPGTDRSNHKRALPGASTVAVEDGRAQKRKHARSSPFSLLSGQSPTCYVTVDKYPGSGQRCQAGMMPRQLFFFCVPKVHLCLNEMKVLLLVSHVAC
jgi:hypothetical protein